MNFRDLNVKMYNYSKKFLREICVIVSYNDLFLGLFHLVFLLVDDWDDFKICADKSHPLLWDS
jgi:hypothetical protein